MKSKYRVEASNQLVVSSGKDELKPFGNFKIDKNNNLEYVFAIITYK